MKEKEKLYRLLGKFLAGSYSYSSEDINYIDYNQIITSMFSKLFTPKDKDFEYIFVLLDEFNKQNKDLCNYKKVNLGYHSNVDDYNNLHKRLNSAISSFQGKAQNGMFDSEFDKESQMEYNQNILNFIKDMMTAFDVKKEDL